MLECKVSVKDKNGVLLNTGDIVMVDNQEGRFQIRFDNNALTWVLFDLTNMYDFARLHIHREKITKVE